MFRRRGVAVIRVVIVDDHEVVRVGLASLLEDEEDIHVVGLAGSAAEALSATRATQPDVLVLDVRLPDRNGIHIVSEAKAASSATRVLVLTSYTGDDTIAEAVAAGADGFAPKTTEARSLVQTIRDLAQGKDLLRAQVSAALIRYLRNPGQAEPLALHERLTARESQIAAFVAEGLSNREIGERVGIAEKTVKNHVSNILNKMNAHRRAEIIHHFWSTGATRDVE